MRIEKQGERIFDRSAGFADLKAGRRLTTDEFFPIGSNTKLYTSVGVLTLAEKGLLDLNQSVNEYRTLKLTYGDNISVKNLLCHNSGLQMPLVPLPVT